MWNECNRNREHHSYVSRYSKWRLFYVCLLEMERNAFYSKMGTNWECANRKILSRARCIRKRLHAVPWHIENAENPYLFNHGIQYLCQPKFTHFFRVRECVDVYDYWHFFNAFFFVSILSISFFLCLDYDFFFRLNSFPISFFRFVLFSLFG